MANEEKSSGDSRRIEIARVALTHFLEKGYGSASMAGIARDVGIEKASLYHHFGSKEDLFLQALAVDFAEPMDRISALAADPQVEPKALFVSALRILYDVMLQSPIGRLVTVISETARTQPTVARGFHDRFILRFEAALAAAYQPAVEADVLRPLPQDEVNMLVFAPLMEMSITAAIFEAHPDLSEKYIQPDSKDRYVAMMLDALRARTGNDS
ncbi:MAG: TetR/AcrR family transcriptional regulator [Pseudomonadota bacterium]